MGAYQRGRGKGSGFWRLGLQIGLPLGLLLAGVGSALLGGGAVGVGIGLFLIVIAVILWVSVVLVGLFSALVDRKELLCPPTDAPKARARAGMRGIPRFVALEAGGREKRRGYSCVGPGDYVASRRALYRIEHVAGTSLLVEDCRSGELIDIDREECARLRLVRPARGNAPSGVRGSLSSSTRGQGRGARPRRPPLGDPRDESDVERAPTDRELHTP